ncbi:MAG: HAD family hydrolase [Bacilli bacterium]|jgi:FMN phosphatase YigB (HAD superfamily)
MIKKDEINNSQKIKCVMFDIDGTLVEYRTLMALIDEALQSYNILPQPDYYRMQGEGVIKTLTLAADDPNYFSRESLYANWEESLAFLKNTGVSSEEFGAKMINLEPCYTYAMPGVKSTLEMLRVLKYRLICSTNWFLEAQLKKLNKFDLCDYFETVYTCENRCAKPGLQHFENILSLEGLNPDEIIMVGDSRTDLNSIDANIQGILYDPYERRQRDYDKASAVITDLTDVPRILQKVKK